MITVEVALGSLIKDLDEYGLNCQQMSDVKLLLTITKEQLNLYSKTWNSIYWKRSRVAVKKRVRAQLNAIARMAYGNLCEIGRILQEYERSGDKLPEPITARFTLMYYDFCKSEAKFLPEIPDEYRQDEFSPISKIRLLNELK